MTSALSSFVDVAFGEDAGGENISTAFLGVLHDLYGGLVRLQSSNWKVAFLLGLGRSAAASHSSVQTLARSNIFDRKLLGLLFSFVEDEKAVSLRPPTLAMHLRMCGTPRQDVAALTGAIMTAHGVVGPKARTRVRLRCVVCRQAKLAADIALLASLIAQIKPSLSFAGFKEHYRRALEAKPRTCCAP